MTNYIFGYGSLMNSSSRQLTGQTGQALPAIVNGLVRHWGKIDTTLIASPLVAEFGDGQVNGVLLEIDSSELTLFDQREKGYQRHRIALNNIECSQTLKVDAEVWVYIKSQPLPPCENTPVLQTYVDTVLEGCLEVSESFAQFFIDNTQGWQYPIANDRSNSRYVNYAGVEKANQVLIDNLLKPILKRD